MRLVGGGADVHVVGMPAEQAQHLDRLVAGGAEPVRQPGVELGHLTRPQRDIAVGEDQAQPSG